MMVVVVACGGDDDGGDVAAVSVRPDSDGRVQIVADAIEWDVDEIVVEAGVPFVIEQVSDDADSSIAHNVHVPTAAGSPKSALEAVERQELRLTIDEPGEYPYVCDLHPTMRGTIVVEEP